MCRSRSKISAIKDRIFSSDTLKLDRPLRLVCLLLRTHLEESLLQDCKDFWKQFSRTPSCFTDLKRAVEKMSEEERTNFVSYLEEDMTATKPSSDESESKHEDWARREICVLKFTYLAHVSLAIGQVPTELLESLIERTSRISQMLPKDPDPTTLIAYCLTRMHSQGAESGNSSSLSSRLFLQATMLVRTAVDHDTEKENRPLALLATRMHLNMGFGRAAFQLWKHVKVKEMLVDTLSPYLLSRIALTQPFDVKHHQGFSADKELKHVIETIDRMSRVQEGLIFRDIKRFHWDSAFDLISMNAKLTNSQTRHTAVLERRRIARLRGEPAGDLPDVNYRSKKHRRPVSIMRLTPFSGTHTISDNIDRAVLPAYENSGAHRPYSFLMPDFPVVDDIATVAHDRESVSKILYRDGLPAAPTGPSQHTTETSAERHIRENFWTPITALLYSAHHPDAKVDAKSFTAITTNLKQLRSEQDKILKNLPTGNNAVEEAPMINESMLIAAYSALEVLRALPRLVNEIREHVVQNKSPHPMKSQVPKDWAKDVDAECKAVFEAIGKVAQGYIGVLQNRGAVAFKAQMRWGKTGEALESLINDGDVDFYAKEYADAAVEAWKGVASVKMK